MGFIERVRNRLQHVVDYGHFKNLVTAYQLVGKVGVGYPKVYATLSLQDAKSTPWGELARRLPNLFVMRPSVFLNTTHDYFIRNDGPRGLMNFNLRTLQMPQDAIRNQQGFIKGLGGNPLILFEEFPLTHNNTLCYPVHFRVHMFGSTIGCIQGVSNDNIFWMDTDCKILASGDKDKDVDHLIPNVAVTEDICSAAKAVSIMTNQPYIRVDFVAATRCAIFRSFACIPGDVRSDAHNWFYTQRDDEWGQLWEQAAKIIEQKDTTQNVDSSKPKSTTTQIPDDNA